MSHDTLAAIAAVVALVGLMAYAVFGGADFGGGVWTLFAGGPRRSEQRQAIARAMGPVWEANHIWLIFVVVVLFTCFPAGYSALVQSMFLAIHLAMVGIMLRGAAFVFRGMEHGDSVWERVFGVSSVITPVLLGAAFGAITAGRASQDFGEAAAWARPYSFACGALALSACAYLAAVYLCCETRGDLREDFRRRAIVGGTATAALAIVVLALAFVEAPWFAGRLLSARAAPALAAGLVLFALSAWAVFGRHYKRARLFAAGEIVVLLLGWGLAQWPYLAYPDVTLPGTKGPEATIRFLLLSLPVGAVILVPSLVLLFRVFRPEPAEAAPPG